MSNSLKHAFTTKAFGEIEVKIKEINENQIQFVYRDNGEWKSPIKEDSFGLELIETLAEQLNGKLERTIENGTKYTFKLKTDQE